MSDDKDNAGIKIQPPIIYIIGILMGVGFDYIYAFKFGYIDIVRPAFIVILSFGILVIIMSVNVFKQNKQSPNVHASQPKILRTGVYAYSRNPIYVAASSLMAAGALYSDKIWILVMLVPVLIYINNQVIKKEEAYLEQKFGDDYRDYKKKVRRWI